MIVCSCNVLSSKEIEAVVEELAAADPDVVLTPGMIYRALGSRPKCGTCLQHVVQLMHAHREALQEAGKTPSAGPASPADSANAAGTANSTNSLSPAKVEKETTSV